MDFQLNPAGGTCRSGWQREEGVADLRFVHLFRNCVPSLRKSRGISAKSLSWSDIFVVDVDVTKCIECACKVRVVCRSGCEWTIGCGVEREYMWSL